MKNILSLLLGALIVSARPALAAVNVDVRYPTFNVTWDGDGTGVNLQPCGVGDMNGDGNPDMLFQEAPQSSQGRSANGVIYIVLGPQTANNQVARPINQNFGIRIDGAASNDRIGWCYIQDFNNDGYEDLMVQATGSSGANYQASYVMYGPLPSSTGTVIDLNTSSSWNMKFTRAGAGSDWMYPAAGDLNNDGVDDLIFEVPWEDLNGGDSGSAYVIYGGATMWPSSTGNTRSLGTASTYNIRFDGPAASSNFASNWVTGDHTYFWQGHGWSIGDLNNDGNPDISFVCGRCDVGTSDAGSVYVSTGPWPAGGSTGNVFAMNNTAKFMVRFDGQQTSQQIAGRSWIGDVSGDGNNDLCFGSGWQDMNGADSGSVYCINGPFSYTTGSVRPLSTTSNYNIRFDGNAASTAMGSIAVTMVDLNNDGVKDLAMESFYWDNGNTDAGVIFVVYGGATNFPSSTGNAKNFGTSTNYSVRIYDDVNYIEHMTEVPTLYRDLDGDGITDILMAAHNSYNNGSNDWGRSLVLFGPLPAGSGITKSLNTDADLKFHNGAFSGWTWPIQMVGDFDRDGLLDWVFGFWPQTVGTYTTAGRNYLYTMNKLGPQISTPKLFSNTTTPNIQWSNPNAGTQFRVQVGPDPLFLSPLFDQTVTVANATVSPALTNGQTYYARVMATNGNYTRWSAVVSFTVDNTAMTPPVLLTPGNDSGNPPTINTQTPVFDWTDASPE